jgi:hypothetical protein
MNEVMGLVVSLADDLLVRARIAIFNDVSDESKTQWKMVLGVQVAFYTPIPIGEEEIDMEWLNRNSAQNSALRGAWTKRVNAQFWRVMGRSRTATFLRLRVRRWRKGSARVGGSVSRN